MSHGNAEGRSTESLVGRGSTVVPRFSELGRGEPTKSEAFVESDVAPSPRDNTF